MVMTRRDLAGILAFLALLALIFIGLAVFWPAQGMAQLPQPVTPTTTPGPAAPFAGRSVANAAALPVSGNALGDCRSTRDTGLLYCWNGSWVTGSGGGGSGTLTSFGVSSLPWLAVGNPTTTPVLSPATGQTSGLVVGTCGSATTVGLCAITSAMIPTLNQSTTGNASTSSDGLSSASGTAPLNLNLAAKALTGSVAITPANAGGAVALQSATPGTAQTGNANLSGAVVAGGFSGPLTGNVTGNVTGSSGSTTGNAGTASALAATPTLCSSGSAPSGVLANGNATGCAAYLPSSTTYAGSSSVGGAATSSLTTSGANWTVRSCTGSCTLVASDSVAEIDASGGAATVTLPTASTVPGRQYKIKKTDSSVNVVTIAAAAGDTISGLSSVGLRPQQYVTKDLWSSGGTTWDTDFPNTAAGLSAAAVLALTNLANLCAGAGNQVVQWSNAGVASCITTPSGGSGLSNPLANGSASTPGLYFNDSGGSEKPGFYDDGSHRVVFATTGTNLFTFDGNNGIFVMGSGGQIRVTSGDSLGSPDLNWFRSAASEWTAGNTSGGNSGVVDKYTRFVPQSAAPYTCASGTEGAIYFNSTSHIHCMCTCPISGCAWSGVGGLAGVC
jgi:hypothetical protein